VTVTLQIEQGVRTCDTCSSSGAGQEEHWPRGASVSDTAPGNSIEAIMDGVGKSSEKSVKGDGDSSNRSLFLLDFDQQPPCHELVRSGSRTLGGRYITQYEPRKDHSRSKHPHGLRDFSGLGGDCVSLHTIWEKQLGGRTAVVHIDMSGRPARGNVLGAPDYYSPSSVTASSDLRTFEARCHRHSTTGNSTGVVVKDGDDVGPGKDHSEFEGELFGLVGGG